MEPYSMAMDTPNTATLWILSVRSSLGAFVVALLMSCSCHNVRAPAPAAAPAGRLGEATSPVEATAPGDPAPERVEIPVLADESDRWIFVEKARRGTSGAWVTGQFDPQRNRLAIRTHDVERFAVDTSRININWDRLVVLRLNGSNSELRHREHPVLHFALDDHGAWVVLEP